MSKRAAKQIGNQLKALRERLHLTVAELATVLRVKRQMVYNYEGGLSLPTVEKLKRVWLKWGESFELDGCKVFAEQRVPTKSTSPQPVQQVFPFNRSRKYKKASVSIKRSEGELVITAIVKTSF